jgi:hypothetical protein
VVDTDYPIGEGEMVAASIIFPGTSREATVIWAPDKKNEKVDRVVITGEQWMLPAGIRPGDELGEVAQDETLRTSEGRRIRTQIDRGIVDFALQHREQLSLRMARLEMHPAQRAAPRFDQVVLHEVRFDPGGQQVGAIPENIKASTRIGVCRARQKHHAVQIRRMLLHDADIDNRPRQLESRAAFGPGWCMSH